MKIHFLLIALITLLSHDSLAAKSPSPEIQNILKERYDGKYDLNLNGLSKSKLTTTQLKRLDDKSSFEIYHVPYPKGTADYFGYSIYRFKNNGDIWIVKSGGVAGVSELYIVVLPPKASKTAMRRR